MIARSRPSSDRRLMRSLFSKSRLMIRIRMSRDRATSARSKKRLQPHAHELRFRDAIGLERHIEDRLAEHDAMLVRVGGRLLRIPIELHRSSLACAKRTV